MKKYVLIAMLLFTVIMASGCATQELQPNEVTKAYPVVVDTKASSPEIKVHSPYTAMGDDGYSFVGDLDDISFIDEK